MGGWIARTLFSVCSMYVCMVTHHIADSKSEDQPGKDANPTRGQLNMENNFFPVPVRG